MKLLTHNLKQKAILSFLIVAIIATIIAISSKAHGSTSFNGTPNLFFVVGTSSPATLTSSSQVVLATSTGRTWARISNTSATNATCIYANGNPATVNKGFVLAASSTFEMNQLSEPVYTGAVSCISDGASSILYVEANQ